MHMSIEKSKDLRLIMTEYGKQMNSLEISTKVKCYECHMHLSRYSFPESELKRTAPRCFTCIRILDSIDVC